MKNKLIQSTTNFFRKAILHLFKRTALNAPANKHYDQNGIDHDHGVINNYIHNSDRNFMSNILKLNRDLFRGDQIKTAVYLAAGNDSVEGLLNRYSNIKGINNLILIDYRISEYNCIIVNDTFRIFTIPSEVVRSSRILDRCNVKIDILIDINCGINLGNGYFSTNAVLVQSLFEPMCNKEGFIFIGSYLYQKSNGQYKPARDYLHCFQYETKKQITSNDLQGLGYEIDLPNLTTYPWSSKEIDITLFNNKVHYPELTIKKGDITLHFIKGNIFSMKNELDIMLLYYRNLFMYSQFNGSIINALDFRGVYRKRVSAEDISAWDSVEEYNFMQSEDLVQFSNTYHVNKVGFLPLKDFDYASYINNICSLQSEITDLYFYYFDPKDLNKIYQIDKIME
ncbi:MAG: hypothetical protein PHS59_11470 [Paludibacter sp.]|nr:hypothetical protein [Paludibacter sp.]